MTITLEQITAHKERLQREVVKCECLIAGLTVLQTFLQKRPGEQSVELGSFDSVLAPPLQHSLKELADATPPEQPALPAAAPEPPYTHPELEAMRRGLHGYKGKFVSWAIQRMTNDWSLHDIAALLNREGGGLFPAEISVVLTRMKSRGEIEEIQPGAGPHPAIFRKPESAVPAESSPALTETETPGVAVV
jgi:hypothetical protein